MGRVPRSVNTAMIDVSAREQGRRTWPATPHTSWLGKSFDTFASLPGPCIATADEVKDPNDLVVRFWNDWQLRHNYNTDDMEHRVPELVEFATTVGSMNRGISLLAAPITNWPLVRFKTAKALRSKFRALAR